MELLHAIFQYNRVLVCDLLDRLFNNYKNIDDQLFETNRELYTEATDPSKPIDIYFFKREKCTKIAADGDVPIGEADMVLQLQFHLAKTGMVNSAYTKWKKQPTANYMWKISKTWFQKALKDVEAVNKLATREAGLIANEVIKKKHTKDKVRNEIQDQLGDALNNLAITATAKIDTIDKMANSIAELTATNAKLREELKKELSTKRNCKNGGNVGNISNSGSGNRNRNSNNRNNAKNKTWPDWCDPNAYCWTCRYKLKKDHNSANCRFSANQGH